MAPAAWALTRNMANPVLSRPQGLTLSCKSCTTVGSIELSAGSLTIDESPKSRDDDDDDGFLDFIKKGFIKFVVKGLKAHVELETSFEPSVPVASFTAYLPSIPLTPFEVRNLFTFPARC